MSRDNIIVFEKSGQNFCDELTDVLREGAQKLLKQAVEEEVRTFLERHAELRSKEGHQQIVRNGYLPSRKIQTGIGSIEVQVPRTRDRS